MGQTKIGNKKILEKEFKCKLCGKFTKRNGLAQKYCGIKNKTGCSGIKYKEKEKKKRGTEAYKENQKRHHEKQRIERKSKRLKLRFQILQEYNYTCQYCGRKAPEVILEIDHKYPKSKGGLDKIENYTVACKDCNYGKNDSILNEFI